jgi:hypothetical protein
MRATRRLVGPQRPETADGHTRTRQRTRPERVLESEREKPPCEARVSSNDRGAAARAHPLPPRRAGRRAAVQPDSAALTTTTRSVSASARFTAQGRTRHVVERRELGILDVVDDDVAVEPPRQLRRHERLDSRLRRRAPGLERPKRLVARRTPSCSSSVTTAETAAWRGSEVAAGIGSAGGSTRSSRACPRPTSASRLSPRAESEARPAPPRPRPRALARCAAATHGILRCGCNDESRSPR